MPKELEGRVAIVTGGASGIGAAIARVLGEGGAKVLVADLNRAVAEAMAEELREMGAVADSFEVDVADAAQVKAMLSVAVQRFGGWHLTVNNAGIGGPPEAVVDLSLEGWRKVIDVNLNGVFYAVKYQIAAMLNSGGGAIVNMSSILGLVEYARASAYVTSKHALQGLTKTAALEYATKGVRVNGVGPVFVETPLLTRHLDQTTLDALAEQHLVGRIGRPEEVSAPACFLLSDRASFITGSYHFVDGGYTAR